jgi:hypothetical protein
MRKIIISLILAVCLLGSINTAQAGNFGLGVVLGDPTGLSFKVWTNPQQKTAIDGALAWSVERHQRFVAHIDYLYHNFNLINLDTDTRDAKSKTNVGRMPLYYGVGGRLKLADDPDNNKLGIRIPVGLEYLFANAPVDIFFEVAPFVNLIPETSADIEVGLGIRFFFP